MIVFIVEKVDTASGWRERHPFRFNQHDEAAALAAELMLSDPQYAYIVKLVPAA